MNLNLYCVGGMVFSSCTCKVLLPCFCKSTHETSVLILCIHACTVYTVYTCIYALCIQGVYVVALGLHPVMNCLA